MGTIKVYEFTRFSVTAGRELETPRPFIRQAVRTTIEGMGCTPILATQADVDESWVGVDGFLRSLESRFILSVPVELRIDDQALVVQLQPTAGGALERFDLTGSRDAMAGALWDLNELRARGAFVTKKEIAEYVSSVGILIKPSLA